MSKKAKSDAPRVLTCALTGATFIYSGVGRPPKYSPDAQKLIAKGRRRKAYQAKREKDGKTYTPREAAAQA